MPTQTAEKPASKTEEPLVTIERTPAKTDERNPLDISFYESGTVAPIYYNPYKPGYAYYRHERDTEGRSQLVWRGHTVDGTYRFNTPREEGYVRADISKWLNGNPPERWMGDTLEEEDRWYCGTCPFNTRNIKVARDHQKFHKHQERPPR